MGHLSLYRHKRVDGATRVGIELNGETVFHHFEQGQEESDPVLRWFVDVRCEGPRVPGDPSKAKDWLLRHANVIHTGLTTMAEELRGGAEPDVWPIRRLVGNSPRGTKIIIVCSATYRMDSYEIAQYLKDTDDHWEEMIERLEAYAPPTSLTS